MTAHKAQGQTLEKVIVDLESYRGTESPYVMVSHVTSLKGLLILRPFKFSKIKCHQSQDTRREFSQLNMLRLRTIVKIGTSEEQQNAIDTLSVNESGSIEPHKPKQRLPNIQHEKVPLHSMWTDEQTQMEQQTRMEQQTWTEQQTQTKQQTRMEQQTWTEQQTQGQTNTDTTDNPTLESTPTTLPSKRHKSTLHHDDFSHKRRRLR